MKYEPDWTDPVFDAEGRWHVSAAAARTAGAPLPLYAARSPSVEIDINALLDFIVQGDRDLAQRLEHLSLFDRLRTAALEFNAQVARYYLRWDEDRSIVVRKPGDEQ